MKTILMVSVFLMASASFCFSAPINGGFESGLTGWTQVNENDGSNWGYSNDLYTTTDYHYSGTSALWGKATIVGDYQAGGSPYPWDAPGRDWSHTHIWSGLTNLTNVTSIQLYLTDFQSSSIHSGWGWGQEVFLALSDGTYTAQALLVENHEPTYTPQPHTTSVGSDGRTWFGFDIALTTANFGSDLNSLNKSSAKVGVYWEADSWEYVSQTLWAGAAVDDIQLTPEPATISLLVFGGIFLLRRKK
ncbi:MAG: PEP-CTERM sorting domain-containing protein [Planctomycetota bacterium]|nr:PEP-CTERM sorting domain-containing protein [Planctomycetota bacterium]